MKQWNGTYKEDDIWYDRLRSLKRAKPKCHGIGKKQVNRYVEDKEQQQTADGTSI